MYVCSDHNKYSCLCKSMFTYIDVVDFNSFLYIIANTFQMLSLQNLETDLAEAREQMKELRNICSNLSSQVAMKQEELSQKDCDVIRAK